MKLGIKIFLGVMIVLVMARLFEWQRQKKMEMEQRLLSESAVLKQKLDKAVTDLNDLNNTDQIQINKLLTEEIKSIKQTYGKTVTAYENLVDLKGDKKQFVKLDTYFAQILAELAKENYASAGATLKSLGVEIEKETEKRAVATLPPAAKASGQSVTTDAGNFTVNVISADLRTTKVVVDTASENDCNDNCPVLPLASYVARSGAFAAINGPYFCPASYPACSGKKNSFDTLMMNKNKHYFNSGNNVYSSVPAANFSTTSRFVTQSSQWGRDTGVDSVIAGQPLLVFNGQSQFSGDGDLKKSGKGTRAFIGATDNTVYIGLVYNATVAEMANVVAKMGIRNAINLDSGGSIAMWNNGRYVAGPGRDLPFGIMLVRR